MCVSTCRISKGSNGTDSLAANWTYQTMPTHTSQSATRLRFSVVNSLLQNLAKADGCFPPCMAAPSHGHCWGVRDGAGPGWPPAAAPDLGRSPGPGGLQAHRFPGLGDLVGAGRAAQLVDGEGDQEQAVQGQEEHREQGRAARRLVRHGARAPPPPPPPPGSHPPSPRPQQGTVPFTLPGCPPPCTALHRAERPGRPPPPRPPPLSPPRLLSAGEAAAAGRGRGRAGEEREWGRGRGRGPCARFWGGAGWAQNSVPPRCTCKKRLKKIAPTRGAGLK